MLGYYYYLYSCLYIEQFVSSNFSYFSKFSDLVEIRVRVREEDVSILLDRLYVLLNFVGEISGSCGVIEDITDYRKHSANVVDLSVMVSGIRAVAFKRMVNFLFIPLYVSKYGFRAEWVNYEHFVKIYFTSPALFFNYVGGEREDFGEHIILILRKRYG